MVVKEKLEEDVEEEGKREGQSVENEVGVGRI